MLKGRERGRERGYLGTRECNGRVRRRLISPHPTPLMLSHAQIAPSPFKACQVDYTLICYKNLYLHGPWPKLKREQWRTLSNSFFRLVFFRSTGTGNLQTYKLKHLFCCCSCCYHYHLLPFKFKFLVAFAVFDHLLHGSVDNEMGNITSPTLLTYTISFFI